ncbi:MAG: 2,4-dichlorophenoxyacetate dioxygenase [Rhodospirillales bacterium 70-18]|nr:TauD/TfdA family dioxygenase [Rhodospirillales bacterium]OJY64747.1 MAG: 2,4-dichlorophenoxyacetate dioxygenase [Rhodospirillales bacterium 70-18]
MQITRIHPSFVAEVSGLDLRQPLNPAQAAAVQDAMDRHAVLVFHDQAITDDQQKAFARNFGTLEFATGNIQTSDERRLAFDMADISNLDQNNKLFARDDRRRMFNLGNLLWHSDSSFKATPAKFSALSARAIPSAGGDTQFADMRAAYDALDDATRAEIADMVTHHSLIYSRGLLGFGEFTPDEREKFAPVRQRLVRRNAATGRKSIFLSSHIGEIEGMPRPEAMALIRDLMEHATQPQFVYTHKWRLHDLVMWDNRQTMHRARRYNDVGEIRDMRRTTVEDIAPTLQQAA